MYGMTTKYEHEFLENYAQNTYTGDGEIVELGCWLGASTIPMAKGLSENLYPQAKGKKVQAYDRFIWTPNMEVCVTGTPLAGKYQVGDNCIDACHDQIQPWQSYIDLHAADLLKTQWTGQPIEMLFIDAMKSWGLLNSIVNNFFPFLVPGKSLIIHQDYTHYYSYWIQLLMYRFQDYFEPVCDISHSASLVFKYTKQIPQELLNASMGIEDFSEKEIMEAFELAVNLVSVEKKPTVLLCKFRALMAKNSAAFTDSSHTLDKFEAVMGDIYWADLRLRRHLEQQMSKLKQVTSDLQQTRSQQVVAPQVSDLQKPSPHVSDLQRQLAEATANLELSRQQVLTLKNEVQAMQTSKFWKLRTMWFQVKGKFGL